MESVGAPVVVGILLAAGAGRRYGKPKVLVEGWLPAAVTALRDGGCEPVLVVLGAAVTPVPAGAIAVMSPRWHTGLSESVRAGLDHAARLHADYAVLHVIDTPDVDAVVVARVVKRALTSRSGLARAVFGTRPGHPVVIARRHWAGLLQKLSGDTGAGLYLHSAAGVDNVECADLATGRDHDEPP